MGRGWHEPHVDRGANDRANRAVGPCGVALERCVAFVVDQNLKTSTQHEHEIGMLVRQGSRLGAVHPRRPDDAQPGTAVKDALAHLPERTTACVVTALRAGRASDYDYYSHACLLPPALGAQRARDAETSRPRCAAARAPSGSAASRADPDIPVFKGGGGLRPGVDITSNRALQELLDEGVPFEKLR